MACTHRKVCAELFVKHDGAIERMWTQWFQHVPIRMTSLKPMEVGVEPGHFELQFNDSDIAIRKILDGHADRHAHGAGGGRIECIFHIVPCLRDFQASIRFPCSSEDPAIQRHAPTRQLFQLGKALMVNFHFSAPCCVRAAIISSHNGHHLSGDSFSTPSCVASRCRCPEAAEMSKTMKPLERRSFLRPKLVRTCPTSRAWCLVSSPRPTRMAFAVSAICPAVTL